MAHDVFVSYPNVDKATADAVVNTLESNGIRCWVAPRDVPHGADWAGAIIEAIGMSRMVVLVFSDGTNQSDHILREVRAAADADIPIVPFRTTEAEPTPALKYYIGGTHWLDALSGPLEQHLEELAGTVLHMVSDDEPKPRPKSARPTAPLGEPIESWWSRIPLAGKVVGGMVLAGLVVTLGAVLTSGGSDVDVADDTDVTSPVITTDFTGSASNTTTAESDATLAPINAQRLLIELPATAWLDGSEWVDGYWLEGDNGWPIGSTVDISVNGVPQGSTTVVDPSDYPNQFSLVLPASLNLGVEDEISASVLDGPSATLILPKLTIESADIETNVVSGIADPDDGPFEAGIRGGDRAQASDRFIAGADGIWMFDGDDLDPPLDVRLGDYLYARMMGGDGFVDYWLEIDNRP